jgi:uncharacterized membrane protein YbhN (UPF0104 family)
MTAVRRIKIIATGLALALLAVEIWYGAPALVSALARLRTPNWPLLGLAVLADLGSMGLFARMQRRLLRAAGTLVPIQRAVALAYAAHSLSVTLPGGPVFSTAFNFSQMRRFGATPAAAAWAVAVSGTLSTGTLILIGAVGGVLTRGGHGWLALVGDVIVAIGLAVALRTFVQHSNWLLWLCGKVLTGFARVTGRSVERGTRLVSGAVEQLSVIRMSTRDLRVAMAFAAGNWLLDAMCFGLCCLAAGARGLSVAQIFVAYTAGMAAASVPLVPGGLGVVDGALTLGLAAGGTPIDDAVAGVILYRLISLVLVIGVGWALWAVLRRRREALSEITE